MPDSSEPGAEEPGADEPVSAGRSVFEAPPPGRRVLDGAAFGVYEDPTPRSRWPRIGAALLAVVVAGVGFLVWRAVNTDADLALPAVDTTSTTVPEITAPTVEELEALIPDGLGTCTAGAPPEDGPPRVAMVCPRTGVPEFLVFVLYATVADRADEFESVVDEFGVPSEGADCALGQNGVHDYIGFDDVGRVACFASGGIVDFVWTSDQAPLLVRARGAGSFVDHYAFWDRIIERTDAGFPLPEERALLDRIPGASADSCRRDLELNVAASGVAAVLCEPDDVAVDVASSVQFAEDDAMDRWLTAQRDAASDRVFGTGDDACTPSGFGRRPPPPPTTTQPAPPTATQPDGSPAPTAPTTTTTAPLGPAPDAGFTRYEREGTTGQILCVTGDDGVHRLSWIRDGARVGSVAVSGSGATMAQLLAWWEGGGHRP